MRRCCTYQTRSPLNQYLNTFNPLLSQICQFLGVECHLKLDGYYLQVLVCTFIGVAWLKYFKQILNNLEEAPLLEWHLHHGNASDHDSENSTDSMKMGKMV